MLGELDSKMRLFIDRLSPDQKKELCEILKQANTYLAADMEDVIAILKRIQDERPPTGG